MKYVLLLFCSLLAWNLQAGNDLPLACNITVQAGPDKFVCNPGVPVQLNGSISGAYLGFSWSPTTGMTNPNSLNPTVSVAATTTYTLTGTAFDPANNLVNNWDFSQGNVGFTSDYAFSLMDLYSPGTYTVVTSPDLVNSNFPPCDDHSPGAGNMLIANGATTPGQEVWCQSFTVTPNTVYFFSAWVGTVFPFALAQMQLVINGVNIGAPFTAPGDVCTWSEYATTWNSGGATTATVCLVDVNTANIGNDFGLDDIYFGPACTVTDQVTVQVVNLIAATPALQIFPCTASQVTLSAAGTSAGPNITYQWSTSNGNIVSGANTLNPVVDETGIYNLTVTFSSGGITCTAFASTALIGDPAAPLAFASPMGQLSCTTPTMTVSGQGSSTGPNIAYQWTTANGNILSNPNAIQISVDEPGAYTLTVTNTTNGCSNQASFTVQSPPDIPLAQATDSVAIGCGQSQAQLDGTGSSQGTGILYQWTTNNGQIVSGGEGLFPLVDAAGDYTLTVTDTLSGCIDAVTVAVLDLSATPQVDAGPSDTLTCLALMIQLQAVDTGSAILPGYVWNSPTGQLNGLNPEVSVSGWYYLAAIDSITGCTDQDSVWIAADQTPPEVEAGAAGPLDCIQTTAVFNGAVLFPGNGLKVWWQSTDGLILSDSNTLQPTVEGPGTYILVAQDTLNGCTGSDTLILTQNGDLPTVLIAQPDTLTCALTSLVLDATASSSGPEFLYQWTTPDGSILSGATGPQPTVGAAGAYTLTLTNTLSNCTADAEVQVAIDTLHPVAEAGLSDTLTCQQTSVFLDGSASQTFGLPALISWTGGTLSGPTDQMQVEALAAGSYQLHLTFPGNGCQAFDTVQIAQDTFTPNINLAAPGALNCQQSQLALNATGSSSGPNFAFNWSTPDGNIVSGQGGTVVVIAAPGSYTLTLFNVQNGCETSETVVISQDIQVPVLDAGPDQVLSCAQPNPVLQGSVSGGSDMQYQWTTSNGLILSGANSLQAQVGAPGAYLLEGTNTQNLCSAVDTVLVSGNTQTPVAAAGMDQVISCATPVVSLDGSGSSAGQEFQMSWTDPGGQTFSGTILSVDVPGLYILEVTNTTNACVSLDTVSVTGNAELPLAAAGPDQTLTCDQPVLALDGTLSDQFPGMIFFWTTPNGQIISGQDGLTPSVDMPGTYILQLTNTLNSCIATDTMLVSIDQQIPLAQAGPDQTIDCLMPEVVLDGSVSSAGPDIQYSWTDLVGQPLPGGDQPVVNASASGSYVLTVFDSGNGCFSSDTAVVTGSLDIPVAEAGNAFTLTCAQDAGLLDGSLSAIGPSIAYTWTGSGILAGGDSPQPLVNQPGWYWLTVSDLSNGCAAVDSVEVLLDITQPLVDILSPETITCVQPAIVLDGSSSSQGSEFTYQWSSNDGDLAGSLDAPMAQALSAGTYQLEVTNGLNGCSAAASVQVFENVIEPEIEILPPTLLTCIQPTVTIDATGSDPGIFQWTTQDGNILSGAGGPQVIVNQPGLYTLLLENPINGCSANTDVPVVADTEVPVIDAGASQLITCATPIATLAGEVISPTSDFGIQWTTVDGQIESGADGLSPQVSAGGVYLMTVVNNQNGCEATDQANVGQDLEIPQAVIAPPALLTCATSLVWLDGSGSASGPDIGYQWSQNGNILGATPEIQVGAGGLYQLEVVDIGNGCRDTATTLVNYDTLAPLVNAGMDIIFPCEAESVPLTGIFSGAGLSPVAAWATLDGLLLGNEAGGPGTYTFTAINTQNGCSASDEVVLTSQEITAVAVEIIQPPCPGDLGSITFGAVMGGAEPYLYSLDGGQVFETTDQFPDLAPGNYELAVQDLNGCLWTGQAWLEAPLPIVLELGSDLLLELGETVILVPQLNIPVSDLELISWSPAQGLECTDCLTPVLTAIAGQTYQLDIQDNRGCVASDRLSVRVDPFVDIFIPNVFSPDFDGINDHFWVYAAEGLVKEVKEFGVWSRWGERVFRAVNLPVNAESQGWDGTFRGKQVDSGVFVWVIQLELADSRLITLEGDVTLVRQQKN